MDDRERLVAVLLEVVLLAYCQFKEQHAKREDVAFLIGAGLLCNHFWREILWGTPPFGKVGGACRLWLGLREVDELQGVVLVEDEVAWLEVVVDQALRVYRLHADKQHPRQVAKLFFGHVSLAVHELA